MATKKKNKTEKPPRELTRRALSHHKRQQRRQRIIIIAGLSTIAAIILIVLVGWYFAEYRPLYQAVIKVNDTEFDMTYYLDALAFNTEGQDYQTILSQAETVKYSIERVELIRQGALALGYSATDDEALEILNNLNLSANDATLDMAREQVLLQKLRANYFDKEVPESMPQAHIMAMLLESESQAKEIRARLLSSDNFTALAEGFSLHSSVAENQGDFGWHPESILTGALGSALPVDYAFGAEAGAISQPIQDEETSKPVGYWLARVLLREYEDEAQTQAILLGSEAEALEIKARLEAGEELAPIAEEFSQQETSRDNGGELGVVSKGELTTALEDYLFDPETEIDRWSDPLRDDTTTQGAYWLVMVVDRDDDRPLDSEDRESLLDTAVSEWAVSLWLDPAYVIDDSTLDAEKLQWAAERLATD